MRVRHVALFAVLLETAIVAGGQSVQNGTIQVNTRLVEVSVVVRDKNGPVAGLTKNDFTVFDNGKPQRIDVFSSTDSRNRKQTSVGNLPSGFVSNMMNASGEVPESATVILFDMMNSSNDALNREANAEDTSKLPIALKGIPQPYKNVDIMGNSTSTLTGIKDQKDAIKQLVSYLKTIREGDRVALFTLNTQLHVIQDFTGDPNILLRAAERIKSLDLAGIEVTSQAQLFALLEPPPDAFTGFYTAGPGFADAITALSAKTRATATADAFEACRTKARLSQEAHSRRMTP